MFKLFTFLSLSAFILNASAQTKTITQPEIQPYGKVSVEDLELKFCDFEKDANAEVLFDKGSLKQDGFYRHVRIKIFNQFGLNAANIRLESAAYSSVDGETINVNNGKIEITPIDKKLIYKDDVDKFHSAVVFALPNVKPGSVIEFKYKGSMNGAWFFQSNLPTRYSEIQTDFPSGRKFKFIPHIQQPYVKDIGQADDFVQVKALANISSLPDEPYMTSRFYNLQRIEYIGIDPNYSTWAQIGDLILKYFNWDQKTDGYIKGEKDMINQVKALKSDDEKIAFIFDYVKNTMKWNNVVSPLARDASEKVWDNKTGNSAEINWMVYHLLKKAEIKSYPMMVSDEMYGKLNPVIPNLNVLANMVIYVPVDSVKSYVLDASDKYNLFNTTPLRHLNTYGLNIDQDNNFYQTIFLENKEPAIQSVFLNAEVKPEGKMAGTAEITSYSYNKMATLKEYKTDGEEKYIKYLNNSDNSIKISSLTLEDMDVDSLPLTQKFNFNADLTGADQNYLYFNTNLFSLIGNNPFKNEERFSDIDFKYLNNVSINGIYKLPNGYNIEALPKNMTIVIPDSSITFKRMIIADSGTISVRYVLIHKKTLYFKSDYQDLRGFYKKMYELLNEQIVLKKS